MITRSRLLAILGITEYGPCDDCGQHYPGQARLEESEAAAAHAPLCLARLSRAVTDQLSNTAAKAAVEEYVRLKIDDDDRTAGRRYTLRETIAAHLRDCGADVWSAWSDLAGDSYETPAEALGDTDPA